MVERTIGSLIELLPHPGETLSELLETYGMSQLELSKRTGFTTKHINEVIKGKKPITPDMALKLSSIFNLSASFWNNLQANYDSEYNEIINEESVSQEEMDILTRVPTKELAQYKYIEDASTKNKKKLVLRLRSFFKVSKLTYIDNVIENSQYAYRKNDKYKIDPIKLASWVSMCLSEYKPNGNYLDVDKLKESLPLIKKQILVEDINTAIDNITNIFEECGISFHVIHHLKNVPVQGYIRNMNNRILMCLTIRQKYSDIFWFTLFHEIGHIINNKDKKTLDMVDFESSRSIFSDEKPADEFASNQLIDPKSFASFLQFPITEKSIRYLAKKENVTPSIVVGRLGHMNNRYFSIFSSLRLKYDWGD